MEEQDSANIKCAINCGAVPNNGNCKRNTINCAIRTMFNNSVNKININFISHLVDCDIKISVSGENNSLAVTLRQVKAIFLSMMQHM